MSDRVYTHEPSSWSSLASLVRPRRKPSGLPRFPGDVVVVPRARVALKRLERYRAALGIAPGKELPVLYPHVAFGRLHLAMLAAKDFPLSMLGAVHVGTWVRRHAELPADAVYTLRAWFEGVSVVERGIVFGLVSEVRRGDEVVWASLNTYQVKGRFGPAAAPLVAVEPERPVDGVPTAPWPLPSHLGRTYAAVCGDYNPIHLSDVSARLFGFPGAIVHGYANLAIALDRVGVGDGPVAIDAVFKGPVRLGREAWAVRDPQGRFAVHHADDPRPAVVGTWRPGAVTEEVVELLR